ncbi:MAG: DUF3857 domain-containing protein [Bacteroidales bacterium]|nr:DUF3857 domain-containing protein [Bacteroidales bacterium]
MKRLMLAAFFVGLSFSSYAQKEPIKFGKPSMEDLEMKVYPEDTTASALILCVYGNFDAQRFMYVETTRIKILTKEGLEWGNRTFRSLARSNVRGKTFNLLDGKIVADKLSNKSIFNQELYNGIYITKVTMPNVKVGSVIDIEVSYDFLPPSFYFQSTIPVKYAELVVGSSSTITYKKNYFGIIPFNIVEPGRWVITNVPAFQSEPFMGAKKTYMAHFEFDIQRIFIPGRPTIEFATTWDKVAQLYLYSKYFGESLKSNKAFFRQIADSIKETNKTDEDIVKAALARVHKIKWNGRNSDMSSVESGLLKYLIVKKAEGNSADINLSLINILRAAGLETYPIVMRTRDEGQLSMFNPTFYNLNYVVGYVKVGENFYVVDGTDKNIPFPFLAERCLNGKGRLIKSKDETSWVDLTNNAVSKKSVFYVLNLKNDLTLEGTETKLRIGHYAEDFREAYKTYTSHQEYVDQLMSSNSNVTIEKDTIKDLNNVQSNLVENITESIKGQAMLVDSLAYLYLIPDRMTENPFKQDKRLYPIDFIYPYERSGIIVITLPEGHKVVKLPQSVKYALPDHGASFLFQAVTNGNRISVIYKFKINKTMFPETDYPLIKSLFMQAIAKESEPAIIKIN